MGDDLVATRQRVIELTSHLHIVEMERDRLRQERDNLSRELDAHHQLCHVRVDQLEAALQAAETYIENLGVLDAAEMSSMRTGILEQITDALAGGGG